MIHHINIIITWCSFNSHSEQWSKLKLIYFWIRILLAAAWLLSMRPRRRRLTRSALALQDILNIGTHARSRDLGSREAASQRSNVNHLITDESVNWKAPPFYLTQLTTQSLYILTPPRFWSISNSTFLLYRPCEEVILGWGKKCKPIKCPAPKDHHPNLRKRTNYQQSTQPWLAV